MKKKTQNAILISFFLATILFSCCTHLADDRKSSEFNFSENNLDLGVSSLQDWVKSWGYNETDHGYSVAIDSSGNSYIAGDVYQNGALNATVIKYDTSGVYQWHKTWGGSSTETAQSIYIDLSDYVYITGKARSFNTTDDVFIVKYDSNGNLIWNRTWGGSGNDIGIDLTVDSQGNAYIAGITSSYGPGGQNVIFLIYNSTGHLQDSKIWGGNSDDRANAIVKDSNGNTFIMGETGSFGAGNADVFLLKYNTSRDLEWNTTWGSNTLDRPGDLAIDSNNDLYISGFTYHPDIGTGDENFLRLVYQFGVKYGAVNTWILEFLLQLIQIITLTLQVIHKGMTQEFKISTWQNFHPMALNNGNVYGIAVIPMLFMRYILINPQMISF